MDDYGDITREIDAFESGCALVDRSERGSVLVAGADATKFLHALVSQDLAEVTDGSGVHSLLLVPQGKLDVDHRALLVAGEWWLDCEVGLGAHLAQSLERYRIRVDVSITDRSQEWGQLLLRGPESTEVLVRSGAPLPPSITNAHLAWGGVRVVDANQGAAMGYDIVGPASEMPSAWSALCGAGAVPAGYTAYEVARIASGIGRQGHDTDEHTIPQEAHLELDAISFTKGCFLGQELVCRIDSRGHVNRFLRRVDLEGIAQPPRGAKIFSGEKVVGELTSSITDQRTPRVVALGMVRREISPGECVEVRWGDQVANATVLELSPSTPIA